MNFFSWTFFIFLIFCLLTYSSFQHTRERIYIKTNFFCSCCAHEIYSCNFFSSYFWGINFIYCNSTVMHVQWWCTSFKLSSLLLQFLSHICCLFLSEVECMNFYDDFLHKILIDSFITQWNSISYLTKNCSQLWFQFLINKCPFQMEKRVKINFKRS